jgi:hypothetical protein
MIVPDCSEADDDGDDCVNDENNDFSEVVSTKGGDSDNVPSYYGSDIDEDTHVGVDFEEDSCEALIVDPDGSESSNTMEVIAEDPLLQEVSDLAMGWLVKLRQVHRISESALGDVLRMCMSLHTHFLTCQQKALTTTGSECHACKGFGNLTTALDRTWVEALECVKSPYLQHSYIKRHYPYVAPVWYEIPGHVVSGDGFYYVPILESIQALLSHPLVYDQVLSGPHSSESSVMHDICDGSLFVNHPLFKAHPNALQIIVYYDEFTAVNPMAPTSRKHKLGAIYFSLGNIDPALRSRLEAVHLVCLFPYTMLDVYSIDEILRPLVTDIHKLQKVTVSVYVI